MSCVLYCGPQKDEQILNLLLAEDIEKTYCGNLPNEGQFNGNYWPPRPSTQGVAADSRFIDENF